MRYAVSATWSAIALLAVGCGSGGADVTPPPTPPAITYFQAEPSAVDRDDTVRLLASFTGGAGVVNPGARIMTSGVPLAVDPDGTTTFVLRVTNAQGSTTASVTVQEFDAVVRTSADVGPGSLREAMIDVQLAGGGSIGIATNDPILLGSSLPPVSFDLSLESAGGFAAAIDGQAAHRILFVDAGAHLSLAAIVLRNGRAHGGDGEHGTLESGAGGGGGGGGGMGGAIFVSSGVVTCGSVDFELNIAVGGTGGSAFGGANAGGGGGFAGTAGPSGEGGPGGPLGGAGGGPGQPGGVDGGGGGGASPSNPIAGAGAFGGGGGGGIDDGAVGGFGAGGGGAGSIGVGGAGGFGGGGGADASSIAGAGGGGGGLGGAIFVRDGYLALTDCTFFANAAVGGIEGQEFGGADAAAGLGLGGAIFLAPTTFAFQTGTAFSGNSASDDAGVPGDDDDVFWTFQ